MNKIDVQSLHFYYGRKQALADISLSIADRQITALIGPSGCGKSTFLRCLNRMNDTIPGTRVEGKILLDGQDIYAPETDVTGLRVRVGMAFNARILFHNRSLTMSPSARACSGGNAAKN